MRRDMEIIKEILEPLEKQVEPEHPSSDMEGHYEAEVRHNMAMSMDAGLIMGEGRMGSDRFMETVQLTWKGHDMLEKLQREQAAREQLAVTPKR